ncbi:MFS transporter [Bdellovibrio sp. HCB337]|uniref:MFS transporter n=1 Tax=Bdellovibrio sp. HCB337 TaxID=3394358 RepID=UPI0039A5A745
MIWGYIVIAYLSLFALGISDNIRGPLFPEILQNFAVSDTQGAVFYAMSSFFGFLGSFLVRFLLKKWSRIRNMQLALLMMTVGLAGMGSVTHFSWLLFFSAIFGASMGITGVVQNILVNVGSLPQKRQQMLSGLHANYGIASFLAPLVVAGVSAWLGSWRFVFYIVATVPFALLLGTFFWKDNQISAALVNKEKLEPPHPQTRRDHLGQIFLAVALGFYVLAEIMVSSRLPLFVRRELGVSLEESSYYLTGFFVFLLAGRLLFALYHFRWPLRHMLSAFLFLSAASVALGLLSHPFFLALSGLFMAPFYPLAMVYVSNRYEKNIDSAVSYCMALQSFFTVAMHGLVGYLTDLYGIHVALWVGPMGLGVSFLLLNSFERLFKKES